MREKDSVKEVEKNDADKVDMAIKAITQKDLSKARHLLDEVVVNTPKNYLYSYENDRGDLFVKFWDQEEFLNFINESLYQGKGILAWEGSAYPRAYYQLAYIDVEEGKYESALGNLEASLKLEPDQPKSLIEMAFIYEQLGKHEQALSLYDQALQVRRYILPADKARALRGKGINLIDLGEIDLAEKNLKESLEYDPESKIVSDELELIYALRSKLITLPDINDMTWVTNKTKELSTKFGLSERKQKELERALMMIKALKRGMPAN